MRRLNALVLAALALSPIAFAGDHPHISVDENAVILSGYDAVAYFTENKAVKGKHDYMAVHDGAIYLFASKKNRETFAKNPEMYAPQYGGWCAYGVALGKKFPVDGKAFEVRAGKLYVNLDKSIQKKWAKDTNKFLEDSMAKWPTIKDTPADKL